MQIALEHRPNRRARPRGTLFDDAGDPLLVNADETVRHPGRMHGGQCNLQASVGAVLELRGAGANAVTAFPPAAKEKAPATRCAHTCPPGLLPACCSGVAGVLLACCSIEVPYVLHTSSIQTPYKVHQYSIRFVFLPPSFQRPAQAPRFSARAGTTPRQVLPTPSRSFRRRSCRPG